MNYYSMAVTEDYDRPCFFTQVKPVDMSPANYNAVKKQVLFYITYLQSEVDEAEIYRVIDTVRDLFGLYIIVGGRAVKVGAFDYDFIGSDRNVAEISIELSWHDRIVRDEEYDIMETLELDQGLEE